MSDTYDLIRGLRVVRNFRPEPVSDEHRRRILEAARWTGSSKNQQLWALIAITDPGQRRRLVDCGRFTQPLEGAPLIVAPVKLPGGNDYDMGRLAQNMMLAAAEAGVGSCPVSLHHRDCPPRVLGLPAGHEVYWVVAFGYPDVEAEHRHRAGAASRLPRVGRKPMTELLHEQRW